MLLLIAWTVLGFSQAIAYFQVVLEDGQTIKIDPWGRDSLRVRIAPPGQEIRDDLPGALNVQPKSHGKVQLSGNNITNGNLKASVADTGLLTFRRVGGASEIVILQEQERSFPSGANVKRVVLTAKQHTNCNNNRCCLDLTSATARVTSCHAHNQMKLISQPDARVLLSQNGKCVTVKENSHVEVGQCFSNQDDQKWTYDSNTHQIIAAGISKCLAVSSEETGIAKQNASTELVICNHTDVRQQWVYQILNVTSDSFMSSPSEMIFGFGEHQMTDSLNYKGQTFDMEQCLEYGHSHGGEICLPYIIGAQNQSVQYGFLWNMPNYGSVSFEETFTNWTAHSAKQIDYFVTTFQSNSSSNETAADIMSNYVDAVGHAPLLPWYASGYWHSKNRYSSQDDLLNAANMFRQLAIPISIIVIDYHHWVHMGDWSFDPKAWPDVKGMMQELYDLDIRVMVSVWPFSANGSSSFETISSKDYAVNDMLASKPIPWPDGNCGALCYLYDSSQPLAREYVWSQLKEGYFDYGIKIFWLDASEPENIEGTPANAAFMRGSFEEMGMMFPYFHSEMVYEGMMSAGEKDALMLSRSAWAGMQQWSAAVWSGDTHSDFDTLRRSITAGLNIQLSGIAWWTTDIGGYSGGDPDDPEFRELIVRWFQYGAMCPIFRQHGARNTEPWLLGNESFSAVLDVMHLRNELRPYVMDQMELVNKSGTPINRPLWFDFPDDPNAWNVTDEFMFGPDFLVAPVYVYQARSRPVYFPAGASWTHYFTSAQYKGGTNETVDAPLNQFPLFMKSS
jgi:alpha-D-xyloside xylohydrolase